MLTHQRIGASARLFLFVVLACGSSGCLLTFERDWRSAQRDGIQTDQLAGIWEGTWQSNYNGHTGKLKAIITPCGNGHYHAQYKGTFALVVPFAYETTHYGEVGEDGVIYFSGRQSLGKLAGGDYVTQGWANGATFFATFQADVDHGTFRMHRVGSCGPSGSCCDSDWCGTGSCGDCASIPPADQTATRDSYDAEDRPW
jgi:hypothetical protein